MAWPPSILTQAVAAILGLEGGGERPLPLVCPRSAETQASKWLRAGSAAEFFPAARAPEAALAGLWLYLGFFDECHNLVQELHTPDASYWHAIVHRQEPDDWNAGYWLRRVGPHAVYPEMARAAASEGFGPSDGPWDPFALVELCARARRAPGSVEEALALRLQLIEWQLLFSHCARPR